jgi:nicotinamidase-related amidase
MTVTELDPQTALLVIDLQVGTLASEMAHPVEDIVGRAVDLLTAFRARGLPVVFASVDGTPAGRTEYGSGAREFLPAWCELVTELERRPEELLFSRATWSAFSGTDLHSALQELAVTQVILTGVATSFGVESTARDAYDLGYSVALVSDAMTDRSIEAHNATASRVFPALGQSGSSAEIISLL